MFHMSAEDIRRMLEWYEMAEMEGRTNEQDDLLADQMRAHLRLINTDMDIELGR